MFYRLIKMFMDPVRALSSLRRLSAKPDFLMFGNSIVKDSEVHRSHHIEPSLSIKKINTTLTPPCVYYWIYDHSILPVISLHATRMRDVFKGTYTNSSKTSSTVFTGGEERTHNTTFNLPALPLSSIWFLQMV